MSEKNIAQEMTIKSLLTFGKDIKLNHIVLKNYKLKEIYDPDVLGLVNYYGLIGICTEKSDVIFNSNSLIRQLVDFLNMFTNLNWEYIEEFNVLADDKQEIFINKDNVKDILGLFCKMYCLDDEFIKKESDRDDIDEEMRDLLREFEEEQARVDKALGVDINLTSIIEAISCKHPSVNMISVGEYTIYQLYRAYRRLCKIDYEDKLITAYYAGTVKIDDDKLKSLNWASEK